MVRLLGLELGSWVTPQPTAAVALFLSVLNGTPYLVYIYNRSYSEERTQGCSRICDRQKSGANTTKFDELRVLIIERGGKIKPRTVRNLTQYNTHTTPPTLSK
eukprot:181531_1